MVANIKLTAIQLTSVPDVEANLKCIEQALAELTFAEQHIVVLPECCLFFGGKEQQQLSLAQQYGEEAVADNYLVQALADLAKRYRVTLVAGTIPLVSHDNSKFTNTCCLFTAQGKFINRYDKIHLFDVQVADQHNNYCESKYTQAGNKLAVADVSPIRLGLSVCYDLRFPELYRQLRVLGADIITVPAAFTRVTGKAHWQALLQARAIENQVYIIAAGQEGCHTNGRETWGHSMIISPWGEILACLEQGTGSISVDFSAQHLNEVRQSIPVAQHNKFKSELISYE